MKGSIQLKKLRLQLWLIIFSLFALFLTSCAKEESSVRQRTILLSAASKYSGSVTSGNLMATAIRRELKIDVALYPSAFIENDKLAYVKVGMDNSEIEEVLKLYPVGTADKFIVGNMSGKKLKEFIFARVSEKYTAELQVDGVHYDIRFVGGIAMIKNFAVDRNIPLEDTRYYKVALSNYFFFSGDTFPSYKFRNGMGNYSFKRYSDDLFSARELLKSYLEKVTLLPVLEEKRATVKRIIRKNKVGENIQIQSGGNYLPIFKIQGTSHRSPYYGHIVRTRGVVTAVNSSQWYPWGIDLYMQDVNGDNNPVTSDAIHVHLANEIKAPSIGDEIEVMGTVYEQVMEEGLGKTSIRDVVGIYKELRTGVALPEPVIIGEKGRRIPKENFSTFVGNINLKKRLTIDTDTIDFWESLEGMRVQISNPRVLGSRGGAEEIGGDDDKKYLTLFIRPDGHLKDENNQTPIGGLIIDHPNLDWNPEILAMSTHHLTTGLTNKDYFNVGGLIEGDLTGVLGYEKNIFGGGDFVFLLPQELPEISNSAARMKTYIPVDERPKTKLVSDEDHLTIATYNVKNIAGNLIDRIRPTGEMIAINMKCPDILSLVEIQDDNGVDFQGGSSANRTLGKIIDSIDCDPAQNVNYKTVNIDPIAHKEGGQPGGNIRVSILYNSNKVSFTPWGKGDPMRTHIKRNGFISHNPGRVYAMEKAFEDTRKSIVVQFKYKGKDLYIIGNHFNSKLGDPALLGAVQPFFSSSEERRIPRAVLINQFVRIINKQNPNAYIAVMGDFNAYYTERSMRVLEGNGDLFNLIDHKNLIPKNKRYTTNFNGNSQPLDYIFINQNFDKKSPEAEILNLNSDYMGKLSDHDPFISRFKF